jgi:hypothetical protein
MHRELVEPNILRINYRRFHQAAAGGVEAATAELNRIGVPRTGRSFPRNLIAYVKGAQPKSRSNKKNGMVCNLLKLDSRSFF